MRLVEAGLAVCWMSTAASAQSADRRLGAPIPPLPPASGEQVEAAQASAAPAQPQPTTPGELEDASEAPDHGYAREGVRELGASAGLTIAQDMRAVNFSPSIGYFINDNLEISGILDVANMKAGEGSSATIYAALVEPSFHLPINPTLYGMIGMGLGGAYVSDLGAGLAVAPRIGLDFLIGRSGILRPSLSYQYTTHDPMGASDGNGTTNVSLVAISSALRFNIGYSTIW